MFDELDPSGTNLDPENKDSISIETASCPEFCLVMYCPLPGGRAECQEWQNKPDTEKQWLSTFS